MISVSIIEDHDQYRASLVSTLSNNSRFKIQGVYTSGEEALGLIGITAPDIAIVDIELKSMSGIELIAKIRSTIPNTQFLICTAHQNNENVFSALKAGASGYIVKGANNDEIQNAITELYDGGAPMSPYIARKVIGLIHNKDHINSFGLSDRESEVLSLLAKGLLYKEIADKLAIATNTVKNHCKNIYKRLHVQNKVEAINKYRSL
jgi:NarL family two-component system response regulator LiaR